MRTAPFVVAALVTLCSLSAAQADDQDSSLVLTPSGTPNVTWTRASVSDQLKIGVKGRLWIADMDCDIRVDDGSVTGTSIDVVSVLDVDPREEIPEVEIYFHLSDANRINFHYWTSQFEGSEVLTETVTYSGSVYTLGTTVDTTMDIDAFTLTYERLFPLPDMTGVEFGLQIGVKIIQFSGRIEAVDAPVPFEEKEDFQAPVPVLGARFRVEPNDWVALEAQINGLKLSNVNDVDVTLYDMILEADVTAWEGLYGGIGYHIFHVDVKDDSHSDQQIDVDMTIDGFFFAAGYRF